MSYVKYVINAPVHLDDNMGANTDSYVLNLCLFSCSLKMWGMLLRKFVLDMTTVGSIQVGIWTE